MTTSSESAIYVYTLFIGSTSIKKFEDLPVDTATITIRYKSKTYCYANGPMFYLWNLKKSTVKKILGHIPSTEELARYSLQRNGLDLDELKTGQELNLTNCVIECVEKETKEENYINVITESNETDTRIKFDNSISVKEILTEAADSLWNEFFLTQKGSLIVLDTDITSSMDVISIF